MTTTIIYDRSTGYLLNDMTRPLSLLQLVRGEATEWRVILSPPLEGAYVEIAAKPQGDLSRPPVLSAYGTTDADGVATLTIETLTAELDALLAINTPDEHSVISLDMQVMAIPSGSTDRQQSYLVRVCYRNDMGHPPVSPTVVQAYPPAGPLWDLINGGGSGGSWTGGIVPNASTFQSLVTFAQAPISQSAIGGDQLPLDALPNAQQVIDLITANVYTQTGSGVTINNGLLQLDIAGDNRLGGIRTNAAYPIAVDSNGVAYIKLGAGLSVDINGNLISTSTSSGLAGDATGDIRSYGDYTVQIQTLVIGYGPPATGPAPSVSMPYATLSIGQDGTVQEAAIDVNRSARIGYTDDRTYSQLADRDLTSRSHVAAMITDSGIGGGTVSDPTTFLSTVRVNGTTTLAGSTNVTGPATFSNSVICSSVSTFQGASTFQSAVSFANANYPPRSSSTALGTTLGSDVLPNVRQVQDLMANLVAAGILSPSASTIVPPGWLECDGSLLTIIAYNQLYQSIGTAFGTDNPAINFRLPDLRSEILKGWDHGRGVDVDRAWASSQGDAMRNITGSLPTVPTDQTANTYTGPFRNGGLLGTRVGVVPSDGWGVVQTSMDLSRSVPTAPEFRPRNVAVMYIIRYQ